MSLGGFFKKVTNIARAAGNPGGSLIRAARGQPIVGGNNFRNTADPLSAVSPTPYSGPGPIQQTPYTSQGAGWAAPTMSREQMVAQAIARNAGQPMPQQPAPQQPPMAQPVAPPPRMQMPRDPRQYGAAMMS